MKKNSISRRPSRNGWAERPENRFMPEDRYDRDFRERGYEAHPYGHRSYGNFEDRYSQPDRNRQSDRPFDYNYGGFEQQYDYGQGRAGRIERDYRRESASYRQPWEHDYHSNPGYGGFRNEEFGRGDYSGRNDFGERGNYGFRGNYDRRNDFNNNDGYGREGERFNDYRSDFRNEGRWSGNDRGGDFGYADGRFGSNGGRQDFRGGWEEHRDDRYPGYQQGYEGGYQQRNDGGYQQRNDGGYQQRNDGGYQQRFEDQQRAGDGRGDNSASWTQVPNDNRWNQNSHFGNERRFGDQDQQNREQFNNRAERDDRQERFNEDNDKNTSSTTNSTSEPVEEKGDLSNKKAETDKKSADKQEKSLK